MTKNVGRPRTSSRATIEDAASELFVENTYARTTIDQITQRAGVSRATFFNYFESKADLLWVAVDTAIDELAIGCRSSECTSAGGIRDAVLDIAARFDALQLPLVLTQQDVFGSSTEIAESGLVRVATISRIFSAALGDRTSAHILAGALSAGWLDWARAGIVRRPLAGYLEASFGTAFGGLPD